MQWATISANYKAVNVASAFTNDVPLATLVMIFLVLIHSIQISQ